MSWGSGFTSVEGCLPGKFQGTEFSSQHRKKGKIEKKGKEKTMSHYVF
jgi:hypothetical protein